MIINRNLPFPSFNGVGLQVADLGGSHDDGRATGKQVAALARVYEGAKDSKGKSLYVDWPLDGGVKS